MATTLLAVNPHDSADSILNPNPPKYNFSFQPFLTSNSLARLTTNTPVCEAFMTGKCPNGRRCPKRHPSSTTQSNHQTHFRHNDSYVCKHWLKGLCKRGDNCDFLHEYNLRKMSECQFFAQNGYCQTGDECSFVHIKEESKIALCSDYENGFCGKGPKCEKRHVRRKLCEFYLAGFCPEGRDCRNGVHLKASGLTTVSKAAEGDRRKRVEELERREEENRNEGRRQGRNKQQGGKWRDRKRRNQ